MISERVAQAVRRGHPWVFREAFVRPPVGESGTEIRITDPNGAFVARGWLDETSPIAVRVWCLDDRIIDRALLSERVEHALTLRDRLFATGGTTAFRLINGEGDRMPGVVLDRYESVAVLRLDGDAVAARADDIVSVVWPALEARGVRTLIQKQRGASMALLRGEAAPERIAVAEHGMRFWVDLAHGQKTGAFLDQRENRARVRQMASGRRVLNLFSYAGGFSLAAALGDAREVTSVDIAAAAHKTAQESFKLSGVETQRHRFVAADAFAWLESAKRRGETFDLIVSDPPSFAPNERSLARALKSYRDLHEACVKLLAADATDPIFCASSCSSHVDTERFLTTLDAETIGARSLRVVEIYGGPPDHPALPAFPEGRYLKFVVLR